MLKLQVDEVDWFNWYIGAIIRPAHITRYKYSHSNRSIVLPFRIFIIEIATK